MAAIPFRDDDRTGPDGRPTEYARVTHIQRRAAAHDLTSCSQWDCNHAPELCRTCAQHAPRSAEAGEPEARRDRERKETIRKKGTRNHDKKIQHEHGSCGCDGRGCTLQAERGRLLSILPRGKKRGEDVAPRRAGRDLVLPYERSWKYAPISDREE